MKSESCSSQLSENRAGSRISPEAFYRFALIFSGAILLVIYPLLNGFAWERLPSFMRSDGSDFGQYYTGALVARHGLWQHLYPIQKKEIFGQPPQFTPLIKTPFFPPSGDRRFLYPHFAATAATDVPEQLLALCPQLNLAWRNMYPPPLAIYCAPLAYVDFMTAGKIWLALMTASFFGMAVVASKICHRLFGRTTYAQGWVLLLPLIPIFLGSATTTTLAVGNSSPLLGFLIALVTYAWVRNWQSVMAVALIILVPFKGIGASWYPLFLKKPVKWVTLLVSAGLAVLVNGITLACSGWEPYRAFFKNVLPWANSPAGTGLQSILKDAFGISLQSAISAVVFVLFLAVYAGYWRNREQKNPAIVVASVAGMVSIFCSFNPVVWPNYCTNYLFLPFAGWLFWELDQARGGWKKAIAIMLALNFFLYLEQVAFCRYALLINWLTAKGWYYPVIMHLRAIGAIAIIFVLPLAESLFVMILAFRRLFFAPEERNAACTGLKYDTSPM